MAALILIVEDEPDLRATLEYNLERQGYRTRSAENGREALELLAVDPLPDLVLLDLMLPDIQGTEVCRRIRADDRTTHVAVVMVTAKGAEIDRVVGFEVGADDYVVKPYSVRELLLRVRAVLRRAQGTEVAAGTVSFGRLRLDLPAHRVFVDDDETRLTALEFRLLTTFHDRRGRVQSRERLLADVWGYQADVTTRTVDTHVKRLRVKLATAGTYIQTVRGVGYRFCARPDEAEGSP